MQLPERQAIQQKDNENLMGRGAEWTILKE